MTHEELNAWLKVTASSQFRWTEDEIYRLNGHGAMFYRGGEDGIYMRIHSDGTVEVGNYEGAIPHIGEAEFEMKAECKFDSFDEAFQKAIQLAGTQFLVDMFSGSSFPEVPKIHEVPNSEDGMKMGGM